MYLEGELRAEMARKGFSQSRLAKSIGVSTNTINQKIQSGKFTREEIERISEVLEVEPTHIFLAKGNL